MLWLVHMSSLLYFLFENLTYTIYMDESEGRGGLTNENVAEYYAIFKKQKDKKRKWYYIENVWEYKVIVRTKYISSWWTFTLFSF